MTILTIYPFDGQCTAPAFASPRSDPAPVGAPERGRDGRAEVAGKQSKSPPRGLAVGKEKVIESPEAVSKECHRLQRRRQQVHESELASATATGGGGIAGADGRTDERANVRNIQLRSRSPSLSENPADRAYLQNRQSQYGYQEPSYYQPPQDPLIPVGSLRHSSA